METSWLRGTALEVDTFEATLYLSSLYKHGRD